MRSSNRDRAKIQADAERVLKEIFREAPEAYHKLDPTLDPPELDVVMASVRLGSNATFYPLLGDRARLMVMGGEAWIVTDHDYVNNVYDVHAEVEMEKLSGREAEWTPPADKSKRMTPVGGRRASQ